MGIMVDSQLEIKRIHYLGVESRVTPLEKEYYILCATVLTPVLGQSLLEHGHRQGGALGANATPLESQNPFLVFEDLCDVLIMERLARVISALGKVETRSTFHFSASMSVRRMPIWKDIYVSVCDRLLHAR